MVTVRVYDNYNLIALSFLDADDFETCEFSWKFRAETSGDMEKTNGICRILKSFKLFENPATLPL